MISLWKWTDFQLCILLHIWETANFYSVGYISHIKINEKCHGIYLLRFLTYKGLLLLIAIKITFEHWCPNCIWTSNLGLMCPNVIPSKCDSIIHGSHLDRLSGHCSIYSLKISWIHHFLTFFSLRYMPWGPGKALGTVQRNSSLKPTWFWIPQLVFTFPNQMKGPPLLFREALEDKNVLTVNTLPCKNETMVSEQKPYFRS